MNINELEKIDSCKMYKIYDMWPKIAKEYFEKDFKKINFSGINHIVFVGMGGSGALGDVFASILSKTKIHVCVIKGYHIPKTIDSKTLIVTISVSGNTDETLSVLKSVNKLDCKLVGFSSGGKMEKFCLDKKIEFRKIDQFHSPRASFPVFLYSILNIFSLILPIKKTDVLESIKNLQDLQIKISSRNLSEDNPAISLAKWITDLPLIYYPWGLQSVAIRFKNALQENTKTHVIVEDIVESCHNGIVAWEKKSTIQPILIKGKDDHIKTKEKYKILEEYFQLHKIKFIEVNSIEGSILSKIINLIYLLDYTTIYKAVIKKIDPSPVKSIEFVKQKMQKY